MQRPDEGVLTSKLSTCFAFALVTTGRPQNGVGMLGGRQKDSGSASQCLKKGLASWNLVAEHCGWQQEQVDGQKAHDEQKLRTVPTRPRRRFLWYSTQTGGRPTVDGKRKRSRRSRHHHFRLKHKTTAKYPHINGLLLLDYKLNSFYAYIILLPSRELTTRLLLRVVRE